MRVDEIPAFATIVARPQRSRRRTRSPLSSTSRPCKRVIWTVDHSAAERALDGRERSLRLRSIRAARLRHVGTSAAPFAAERLGAFADKIDGVKARHQIVGHADHDSGFAVTADTDDCDNAG